MLSSLITLAKAGSILVPLICNSHHDALAIARMHITSTQSMIDLEIRKRGCEWREVFIYGRGNLNKIGAIKDAKIYVARINGGKFGVTVLSTRSPISSQRRGGFGA